MINVGGILFGFEKELLKGIGIDKKEWELLFFIPKELELELELNVKELELELN